MKMFLLVPISVALLSGCASYYTERADRTADGTVVYEPAGAMVDPNPNWDVNARDIHQRPYRATAILPWTPATSAVHTSTDADKNMGYQLRPQNAVVEPY